MKAVYSIWIFVFVLLIKEGVVGQEYFQPDVRSKGLAGITIGLSGPWSVFGNQAGLITTREPQLGISYSNYFLLKELSLKAAFVVLPVDNNVFACSYYRFGNQHYNENKLGISFAKEIVPGFCAGFQFNYFYLHFPENDKNRGSICFEGGIFYRISEKLELGAHFFNPFQSGIKTETVEFKLPSMIRMGGSLGLLGGIKSYIEFEKDLENPLITKVGFEYQAFEKVQLRFGIAGKPTVLAFGVGYVYHQVTSNFAWSYHPRLGSTPSFSISYSIK